MSSETVSLLPCPFCGSTDLSDQGPSYTQIMCNGCGASEYDQPSRDEAVAAWNLRSKPVASGVEVTPLDWRQDGDIGRAETPIGVYEIRRPSFRYQAYFNGLSLDPALKPKTYDGPIEALEAVNQDYRNRILSALLPKATAPVVSEPTIRPPCPGGLCLREDGICCPDDECDFETGLYKGSMDRSPFAPLQPQPKAVTEEMRAWQDVIAERQRQKDVEGWTEAHDDKHEHGELAKAAGVYALAAASHDYRWVLRGSPVNDYLAAAFRMWPWDWSWFKPKDRRRDLVKATALLLAEIERLDRAALEATMKEA